MGLEEVKKGLERQLDKERKKLLKEADERAEQIKQAAEQDVAEHEEQVQQATQQQVERLKRKELASANLGQQKRLLMAKKELIDEAFAGAKQALVEMSDKERKDLLKKLRKQAEEEIDVAVVYCAKQDEKLVGKNAKVDASIDGGIICENTDGTQRIDLTLDRLLEDVREAHLKEVADTLL